MMNQSASQHAAPSKPHHTDPPVERDTLPESREWRDSMYERDTEPSVDVDILRAALDAGLR